MIDEISIHALLAESDNSSVNTADQEARFLSTLSLRRATTANTEATKSDQISIHALLAESDHGLYSLVAITPSFLSTLSLRRATRSAHRTS